MNHTLQIVITLAAVAIAFGAGWYFSKAALIDRIEEEAEEMPIEEAAQAYRLAETLKD